MALAATRFAVTYPQNSDFAGVAAAHQAQSAGLGCIYTRSVQLAGAHLVPGVIAPPVPADLIWHFNEPPVMTLLGAPFAALGISTQVNLWEVVIWVALAACAFLLWRERGGLSHWVMAAVAAALLLNLIANTEFSLAQNDALLLIVALLALDLLRKHQDIAAGVLLGVVALKPQLVFLAVIALVIHQRWRVLAACAATVAAIGSISVLMVGGSCTAAWLGSATKLGEFQISIGLPGTLARLLGSTAAAEGAFVLLAVTAVAVLIRIRRRVDTPHLAAIAIALAVVIGLPHPCLRRPFPGAARYGGGAVAALERCGSGMGVHPGTGHLSRRDCAGARNRIGALCRSRACRHHHRATARRQHSRNSESARPTSSSSLPRRWKDRCSSNMTSSLSEGAAMSACPWEWRLRRPALDVVLFDTNAQVVDIVNGGSMPFAEHGAPELLTQVLASGRLRATADAAMIDKSEHIIVVVGTPVDRYLSPDVEAVARVIAPLTEHLVDGHHLVLRSTVYPGVTKRVARLIAKLDRDIDVSFCPERIAEGYALTELHTLPQIVSGTTPRAVERATSLFRRSDRGNGRARARGGRARRTVHEQLALPEVRRRQPALHDRQRQRARLREDP